MSQVEKPKNWPRYAVGPKGNSARFWCAGDVPHGWQLAEPLPGAPVAPPPPVVVRDGDTLVIDGVRYVAATVKPHDRVEIEEPAILGAKRAKA